MQTPPQHQQQQVDHLIVDKLGQPLEVGDAIAIAAKHLGAVEDLVLGRIERVGMTPQGARVQVALVVDLIMPADQVVLARRKDPEQPVARHDDAPPSAPQEE